MEYMGDRTFWDEKFRSRSDTLLAPEKSLIYNISYFKNGSVLDIVCGDGRNAIFLINKGFKVTGIDFSYEVLKRLEVFSKERGENLITKQVDLTKDNVLIDIEIFDNIVINHYRFNKIY